MVDTKQTLSKAYLAEYSGYESIQISIAMTFVATLFISLRFYFKLKVMGRPWGIEDTLLMAAYVAHEGLCVLGFVLVEKAGVGHHIEWVKIHNPSALITWAKSILVFEYVHFTGVTLPKMAIVFFYLRLFQWHGRTLLASKVVLGLLVGTWVASCVTASLRCTPLAFWWDRTIPNGRCINIQAFFHVQALTSPILDGLVIALPIPTIWGLTMAPLKKAELIFTFAVGSFGLIASIIRAAVFFDTASFSDTTWSSVTLSKWSIIEVGTYIVTACLPELKPLTRKCLGSRPGRQKLIRLSTYPPTSPSFDCKRARLSDEEQHIRAPEAVFQAKAEPEGPLRAHTKPAHRSYMGRLYVRRWQEPRNSSRFLDIPIDDMRANLIVAAENAAASDKRWIG